MKMGATTGMSARFLLHRRLSEDGTELSRTLYRATTARIAEGLLQDESAIH